MNKFTGIALIATCIMAGPVYQTFGQVPMQEVAPMAPQPLFAANLGVVYVPIPFNDGTVGLRLTRAPLPGSPASRLPLNAGDIILALDGQRLTNPSDVANHFDQTTVDFVNAGTNTLQRGNINLPSASNAQQPPSGEGVPPVAPAPMVANGSNQFGQPTDSGPGQQPGRPAFAQGGPRPQLARNLGIFYVPIRFGDGTLGLRLTRAPLPGSPASQMPLDAGDIIFALDGQQLTNPGDVANHFDQTTVDFIDSGTNTRQNGSINLPSQNP
jgi:S1-C subfamily serine protease